MQLFALIAQWWHRVPLLWRYLIPVIFFGIDLYIYTSEGILWGWGMAAGGVLMIFTLFSSGDDAGEESFTRMGEEDEDLARRKKLQSMASTIVLGLMVVAAIVIQPMINTSRNVHKAANRITMLPVTAIFEVGPFNDPASNWAVMVQQLSEIDLEGLPQGFVEKVEACQNLCQERAEKLQARQKVGLVTILERARQQGISESEVMQAMREEEAEAFAALTMALAEVQAAASDYKVQAQLQRMLWWFGG